LFTGVELDIIRSTLVGGVVAAAAAAEASGKEEYCTSSVDDMRELFTPASRIILIRASFSFLTAKQ
jgi:hypothetical protein